MKKADVKDLDNKFPSRSKNRYLNKWEKGAPIIERLPIDINPFMAGVITGFTMGEGSFYLVKTKSKTHTTGYFLAPRFAITLKLDDFEILETIKDLLGCGSVLIGQKAASFKVTKFRDILEIIIPFFDQYPLKNIKKDDFNLFKIIVFKFAYGEGRRLEGIERLISIRQFMNQGKCILD